jgi:hypothetical protein
MTKIDWSRTNDEKKVLRQGSSTVCMNEMPISWEEEAGIPKHYRPLLERFVRSVFVADINQTKPPAIPKQLQKYIQDRIDRRGRVLEFAKALANYDRFREWDSKRKGIERQKNEVKIREASLRRIAKYDLRIISLDDALLSLPDMLKGEIRDRQSLLHWAKSQSEYTAIRRQNARKLQRRAVGG